MTAPLYTVPAGAAVALSPATAKSVIGVAAPATFGLQLKKIHFGLDGVTASAVPGKIEVCSATFATNGPGTNSTSITPVQVNGRAITAGFTAAYNWTAGNEPTVLTVVDTFTVSPTGATVIYDFPLGDEPDCDVSKGFVIRCTFGAAVNVTPTLWVARI